MARKSTGKPAARKTSSATGSAKKAAAPAPVAAGGGSKKADAPLDAVFHGTCSLEIPNAPARVPLDHYPLVCDIVFSAARDQVELVGFEPISTEEYQAKFGPLSVTNSTTVKLRSAKAGHLTPDGHFAIPVVLHFDHLFDAPFYEEDSDLLITLSTLEDGGAALDADGSAILVGRGTFKGGALDGYSCRMVYEGKVSPLPW